MATMTGQYRIRWAVVQRCNGYSCWPERMCIAERRISLLWILPMWWPMDSSRWRITEVEAERDIEACISLRQPLPAPRIVG